MTHLSRRDFLRASAAGIGPATALGALPKGAAIYQLYKNPNRATKVLHRKPGATGWEEVELDWAMDRVAQDGHDSARMSP